MARFGDQLVPVAVDANGQLYALIQGFDGTKHRPLKFDSEGPIIAVMKGDFQGVLKTLAVDEDGNLQAVNPDLESIWGTRATVGNAELAARLGSPVRYERRGDLYFLDSFECGLNKCVLYAVGTGGSLDLVTAPARTGGYACKITTATGEINFAAPEYRFPLIAYNKKMGAEFHWAYGDDITHVILQLAVQSPNTLSVVGIRLRLSDGLIEYLNSTGNWASTGHNYIVEIRDNLFHALKLVFDPPNAHYLRLYLDGQEFDLSSFYGQAVAYAANPSVALRPGFQGWADHAGYGYIDDVIFTLNEPAS